jgi:hypothetical protein
MFSFVYPSPARLAHTCHRYSVVAILHGACRYFLQHVSELWRPGGHAAACQDCFLLDVATDVDTKALSRQHAPLSKSLHIAHEISGHARRADVGESSECVDEDPVVVEILEIHLHAVGDHHQRLMRFIHQEHER